MFNGTRTYSGFATGGLKLCGIIHCTNDTLNSCGHIFQDHQNNILPITFRSLEITMQNIIDHDTLFMPTTFSQEMIPLNASDFNFESISTGEFIRHRMKLNKILNNLLTFSIYGRNYVMDGSEVTRGISSSLVISPIIVLLVFVIPFAIN